MSDQDDNQDFDQGDNPDEQNQDDGKQQDEDYADENFDDGNQQEQDEELEHEVDDQEIQADENQEDQKDEQGQVQKKDKKQIKTLPLTIKSGQDENENLKKWKELVNQYEESNKQQRANNNALRNKLKKLGEKAEKLVQANVRKQNVQEQRQDIKHQYQIEQRILKDAKTKQKQAQEYKIDSELLSLLQQIDSQEIQNQQMREQIRNAKERNKNLNQIEEVNDLRNKYKSLQNEIQSEIQLNKKLKNIVDIQEVNKKQQKKDCDYDTKKEGLLSQIKDTREHIKNLQKEELEETRKSIESNNVFIELQSLYRTICSKTNQELKDQDFLKSEKNKEKVEDENIKKMKELQKKTFQENQQQYLKSKQRGNQQENFEKELQEALDKFKSEEENIFNEYKTNIVEIKNNKKQNINDSTNKKKQMQEEYLKLGEELAQLSKLLKEKEFESKATTTKLNDLQRQVQLLEKKPISEPIQSTQQKPESFIFGIDNKTETSLPFDDSKNLDWTLNLPIQQIVICKKKNDELIVGLELYYSDYKSENGIKKTTKHIGQLDEDIDKNQLEIAQDDKLIYMSGFYNQEQIIYLKFETAKNKVLAVGNMKFKDNLTKDFRIDIKDKLINGFTGVLDYTSESQNPSERFLVAIGLNLKPKELDINTKKKIQKQKQREEEEKQRIPVDYRKITYPFKKHTPKNLELVKSQPKLDLSSQDIERMKQINKEKERSLRAQLGLYEGKEYSTDSYKKYGEERKKRKELSKLREEKVEKAREELRSSLQLPQIEQKPLDNSDKKQGKTPQPSKGQQKIDQQKGQPQKGSLKQDTQPQKGQPQPQGAQNKNDKAKKK